MRGSIFLSQFKPWSCLASTYVRTFLPPPYERKGKWMIPHTGRSKCLSNPSRSSNESNKFSHETGRHISPRQRLHCVCRRVTRLPHSLHRWYPSTLPRALRYHLVSVGCYGLYFYGIAIISTWASGYVTQPSITAIWRSGCGKGSSAPCAGKHEANLRLSSTTSSTSVLKTYSPSMSCLAPSTSSSRSTKRISQGAMCGKPQRQRYASSCHLCLSVL